MSKETNEPPVAIVTGASSGFGRHISLQLAERGWRVFGSSRRPDEAEAPEGVELVALDVTSRESVGGCVEGVLDSAGKIDLLVNNAGKVGGNLLEETDPDTARLIFETNFWGAAAMIEAVLPGMRERGRGRIINISSVAGFVGTPGMGFYAASKHALEGYTEALLAEMHHLPVDVHLVEPGFFRTGLLEAKETDGIRIGDYDGIRERVESSIESSFGKGGDPADVARLVVRIAEGEKKGFRFRIGKDAKAIGRLHAWLPEGLFLPGVRRTFDLDA